MPHWVYTAQAQAMTTQEATDLASLCVGALILPTIDVQNAMLRAHGLGGVTLQAQADTSGALALKSQLRSNGQISSLHLRVKDEHNFEGTFALYGGDERSLSIETVTGVAHPPRYESVVVHVGAHRAHAERFIWENMNSIVIDCYQDSRRTFLGGYVAEMPELAGIGADFFDFSRTSIAGLPK